MSTIFNKLSKLSNTKQHMSVFGYVRKMEKELKCCSIPLLIFYICFGYYYLQEFFTRSDYLTISKDKLSVEHTKKDGKVWGNIMLYGKYIAMWKFTVDKCCGPIFIQFISPQEDNICNEVMYSLNNHGCGYIGQYGRFAGRVVTWKTNDIITIILDSYNKNIRIQNNNQQIYTVISNINTNLKYQLRIELCSSGDKLTLTSFSFST